jgi:hypothetical protein
MHNRTDAELHQTFIDCHLVFNLLKLDAKTRIWLLHQIFTASEIQKLNTMNDLKALKFDC